ncbi:hypothetical protein RHSIM_RhsimUnG0058400 [Rhododendron simsii]|uniref:Uncharacterized protein n=1 Tax=Rhododendron simsii TaxID=118357 RepID=A0A834FYQ6_RHOSS|nr:hypothetical protein RHSIM_RhsimUnG0058400 [Rhododendron simsii]
MPVADPNLTALIAKISKFEESVQKTGRLRKGEIDINKLPEKFKGMDFAKFYGITDPKAYLQWYVGSLIMRGIEKEAMAQMLVST